MFSQRKNSRNEGDLRFAHVLHGNFASLTIQRLNMLHAPAMTAHSASVVLAARNISNVTVRQPNG